MSNIEEIKESVSDKLDSMLDDSISEITNIVESVEHISEIKKEEEVDYDEEGKEELTEESCDDCGKAPCECEEVSEESCDSDEEELEEEITDDQDQLDKDDDGDIDAKDLKAVRKEGPDKDEDEGPDKKKVDESEDEDDEELEEGAAKTPAELDRKRKERAKAAREEGAAVRNLRLKKEKIARDRKPGAVKKAQDKFKRSAKGKQLARTTDRRNKQEKK